MAAGQGSSPSRPTAAAPVTRVEDHVAISELRQLCLIRVLGRHAANLPGLAVVIGVEAVGHHARAVDVGQVGPLVLFDEFGVVRGNQQPAVTQLDARARPDSVPGPLLSLDLPPGECDGCRREGWRCEGGGRVPSTTRA